MKKFKHYLPVIFLAIFYALSSCSPTTISVSRYDAQKANQLLSNDQMSMVYFLPKKHLRLEVTYMIYSHIRILGYENKVSPDQFEILTQTALVQGIKLKEEILPDAQNALLIQFENAGSSSNSLNVNIAIDEKGLLSSFNSVNEGKTAEFLGSVVEMGAGVARFGSTLTAAAAGLSGRGDENGDSPDENGGSPTVIQYTIDTLTQTYSKLLEISSADTTIRLIGSDFMPELRDAPEIRIKLHGEDLKAFIAENPLKNSTQSIGGVLYRNALPIRTTIEIRGEDNTLIRDKSPKKSIVFDESILYPQFGPYGIAQIQIQGGGKQVTNIEFYTTGGLKTYSVDKETRNEEKTNQWKKNLQDAQNAALDISLGNKGALNQKKAEISTSELDAMEAQINAEERKLELQKRKAELEKKKKEGQ
jgi:hypothetical protein